jgi:UDP-N-acetylglucosamine transferase subunit ALG13
MIQAIDELALNELRGEEIFAQIGFCDYEPRNIEYAKVLDKQKYDDLFARSTVLVGHAGMGTITMALDHNKPLLVMPRLKMYGEHVNDHQLGTAKKFEELGHILVAYTKEELPEKLQMLKHFVPKKRETQVEAVAKRISDYLRQIKKA